MSTTRPAGGLTPARRIAGSRSSHADGDGDSNGTPQTRRGDGHIDLPLLVGLVAAGFTALYLISDLIEVAQGGFSTFRLALTYAGEAAIPLFVIGLYAVQRPPIGRLGFAGAVAYAYSYVFFTSTVVYALIARTPNYKDMAKVSMDWRLPDGRGRARGGCVRASRHRADRGGCDPRRRVHRHGARRAEPTAEVAHPARPHRGDPPGPRSVTAIPRAPSATQLSAAILRCAGRPTADPTSPEGMPGSRAGIPSPVRPRAAHPGPAGARPW